jgi:hypothetical protein
MTESTHKTDTECPSFYLFPSLPQELRLKIWRLALQPRTVIVRFCPKIPDAVDGARFLRNPISSQATPLPVLF